uniref:Zinc knuckle CX2CX4HX4C n=1 Tax=Tanacetum cinerariifolium TaxID=118510 RepID=A0A6L2KLY7_TANCI|nr:hypothetical protein [Tanacetum cinerariifolium]
MVKVFATELVFTFPSEFRTSLGIPSNLDDRNTTLFQMFDFPVHNFHRFIDEVRKCADFVRRSTITQIVSLPLDVLGFNRDLGNHLFDLGLCCIKGFFALVLILICNPNSLRLASLVVIVFFNSLSFFAVGRHYRYGVFLHIQLGTQIGKPIMLDAFTSSMCVESWGRISFAWALIEINAAVGLKKEVIMAIPDEEGDGYIKEVVRVEYEWKPLHCVDCKTFGHDTTLCPKRVLEEVPKNSTRDAKTTVSLKNDDGFIDVKSRKKNKGANFGGIRLNKPKSKVMWQQKKGADAKSNSTSLCASSNVVGNDQGVSNPGFNTSNPFNVLNVDGVNMGESGTQPKVSEYVSSDLNENKKETSKPSSSKSVHGDGHKDKNLEDEDFDFYGSYADQVVDLDDALKEFHDFKLRMSEETMMLTEESRSKMLLKQQDPMILEKKVNTTPVDYAALNQLSQDFEKQFVPQTELSAKQAFWSQNSMNSSYPSPSCRPTKVGVPKELPKVSMVNTSLKKLKHHLADFDVVVKERTTVTTITEGSDNFVSNQSALNFDQYFKLNELNAQSQEKDTAITKLTERIKSLSGNVNEDKVKKDIDDIEIINIELDHRVSKLISKNEHLKQTYKQLYDSIKPTCVLSKEQCDELINQVNQKSVEISDLNANLQEKGLIIAALRDELRKLKRKAIVDNVVTTHTIAPEA